MVLLLNCEFLDLLGPDFWMHNFSLHMLIVKVSSDVQILLKLVNRYSCRADTEVFCLLGWIKVLPLSQWNWGDKRGLFVFWIAFIHLEQGQLSVAGFLSYRTCGLRLCNSDGNNENYVACIKVRGLFCWWDKFSICERGQMAAPGGMSPVHCRAEVLGGNFYLLCRPAWVSSLTWKNRG